MITTNYPDYIDNLIIDSLIDNPELSFTEIAKKIGISQPTVGKRIKQLKELGCLKKTYITICNNIIYTILRIDIECKDTEILIQYIKQLKNILEINSITGEYNLSFILYDKDIKQAYKIINSIVSNDNIKKYKIEILNPLFRR